MQKSSKMVLAAALPLVAASVAQASFTFPTFSFSPVNNTWRAVDLLNLGGVVVPDGNYTSMSVTVDWSSTGNSPTNSSNAWSSEARIALSSTPANAAAVTTPTFPAGNILYRGVTSPTAGGASNANNTTLSFNVPLSVAYSVTGGVQLPLFLNLRQSFAPFSTQVVSWSNVTVTLTSPPPPPPPPSIPVTVGSSTSSALAAGGIIWHSLVISEANTFIFDTLGSSLAPSNDTEIAIFRSNGNLLAENDDFAFGAPNNLLSRIEIALTPGTYYIAAGAFNSGFATGFTATSTSTNAGTIVLNVNLIPEPAALGLLAPVAVLAMRRRRA